MRKVPAFLISVLFLLACKKSETDQVINIALINPYWDSIRVTALNRTRPELSVYDKWVPGKEKTGQEKYYGLVVVKDDSVDVKVLLKPSRRLGRHPLFITEHNYTDHVGGYRSYPRFLYVPEGELVTVNVSNHTNKYVKGTLLYDGKEDSLFSVGPQDSLRSAGFFRPADIRHIKKPFVKFYYGLAPPYTTSVSAQSLWDSAAKNVTINIP